jgi:uncharacterized protein YndB with AHSA1/START domain
MKTAGALEVTTPTEREIVMTRSFDAPRHLVFEAHARPELLKRWLLGPPGWEMTVCTVDLKVGGAYRYVWRNAEGTEMGMGGVYREVVPSERIVATESFDNPWYPGEAVSTITFDEQNGKTTLTLSVLYESRETRDAVLKTPMEEGVASSYDRLAELLATSM